MRRLLIGLVPALLAMLLAAGTAYAHSGLDSASPGPGETAQAGLDQIEMSFQGLLSQDVKPQVQVTDAAGADQVSEGSVVTDNRMTVRLKPLRAGLYTVQYTVTYDDGHPATGGYYLKVVGTAPAAADGGWIWYVAGGAAAVVVLVLIVWVITRSRRKSAL